MSLNGFPGELVEMPGEWGRLFVRAGRRCCCDGAAKRGETCAGSRRLPRALTPLEILCPEDVLPVLYRVPSVDDATYPGSELLVLHGPVSGQDDRHIEA